jgi:hypothetical protein
MVRFCEARLGCHEDPNNWVGGLSGAAPLWGAIVRMRTGMSRVSVTLFLLHLVRGHLCVIKGYSSYNEAL